MTQPVTSWPVYILNNIPPGLRAEIEGDAEKFQTSMNEVIRRILCHTYKVRCRPVEAAFTPGKPGTTRMLLRLQPALHRKLTRRRNGKTARVLILEALEAHYKEQE